MSAVDEDPEDSAEGEDLQKYLKPLTREQLEMVLAQAISRHEDCFDFLTKV